VKAEDFQFEGKLKAIQGVSKMRDLFCTLWREFPLREKRLNQEGTDSPDTLLGRFVRAFSCCVLTSIAKSAVQVALGPFQRSAEQDLKHSFQSSSKVFTNCSTSGRPRGIRSRGYKHIVPSEQLDCVTE